MKKTKVERCKACNCYPNSYYHKTYCILNEGGRIK